MRKLKGRITMGRWSGTSEGFRVTVEDVLSGCEVIEVEMTMAQFADAITGRGGVSCEFTLTPEQVGMKHEHKAVEVFVPDKVGKKKLDRAAVIRLAVAAHETDGWQGRDRDAENWHNRVDKSGAAGGGVYRVVYDRWVPADDQPPGLAGQGGAVEQGRD